MVSSRCAEWPHGGAKHMRCSDGQAPALSGTRTHAASSFACKALSEAHWALTTGCGLLLQFAQIDVRTTSLAKYDVTKSAAKAGLGTNPQPVDVAW